MAPSGRFTMCPFSYQLENKNKCHALSAYIAVMLHARTLISIIIITNFVVVQYSSLTQHVFMINLKTNLYFYTFIIGGADADAHVCSIRLPRHK